MRNGPELTPPDSPPLSRAYLRPNWFIQRENGAYVPVIPVDELPPEIDLEGAPRALRMDDAQGMKFLEKLPFNGQTYSLANQPPKELCHADSWTRRHKQRLYTESQTSLRPLQLSSVASPAVSCKPNEHDPPTAGGRAPQPTQKETAVALVNALTKADPESIAGRPLPPSGREPDQTKKEYCTYWIKTGECDFTQQGCLYKHEMPDLQTLRAKVGINSVPHWYQVRTAMAKRSPGGRPLVQPPSWLQQRVKAADERAAEGGGSSREEEEEEEESGSDADDEEETKRRTLLLPAMQSPPSAGMAKAKAPAVPLWHRAPEDEVRRSAKRLLESQKNAARVAEMFPEEVQHHHHQQQQQQQQRKVDSLDLIDFSTPDTPPPGRHANIPTSPANLTSPKPPRRTSVTTTTMTTRTRLPAPPTHSRRRSISDAQAEIFNLIRAAGAPPPPSPAVEEAQPAISKKKHKIPAAATTTTTTKPATTAELAPAPRKPSSSSSSSSAALAMKRYFSTTSPPSSSSSSAIPHSSPPPPLPTPKHTPAPTAIRTPTTKAIAQTQPLYDTDSSSASTAISLLPIRSAAAPPPPKPPAHHRRTVTDPPLPTSRKPRSAAAAAAASCRAAVAAAPPPQPKTQRAASGLQASRHASAASVREEDDVPSFEPRMVVGPRVERVAVVAVKGKTGAQRRGLGVVVPAVVGRGVQQQGGGRRERG